MRLVVHRENGDPGDIDSLNKLQLPDERSSDTGDNHHFGEHLAVVQCSDDG